MIYERGQNVFYILPRISTIYDPILPGEWNLRMQSYYLNGTQFYTPLRDVETCM
jgi:hypothetical protein